MNLTDRATVHAALGDPVRLGIVAELELSDRTFQELVKSAGLPGNLAAHHLAVLEKAGLICRRVSEGDRRHRYISLRTERLDGLVQPPTSGIQSVLFVCTHNSARSQYAAAAWRQLTGWESDSVGTDPAPRVHPYAVKAAREWSLDLTGCQPKGYEHVKTKFDLLVSVCDRAREATPPIAGPSLHWSVPDPVAAGTLRSFRSAFADIERRVDRLAASAVTRS